MILIVIFFCQIKAGEENKKYIHILWETQKRLFLNLSSCKKGRFFCKMWNVIIDHQRKYLTGSAKEINYRMIFFFLPGMWGDLFSAAPMALEVPRLGVESELQLLSYSTTTATPDLRCLSNLCCSSLQCWILNPLSKARDHTHILKDTSQVLNPLSYNGNTSFWKHLSIYYIDYNFKMH